MYDCKQLIKGDTREIENCFRAISEVLAVYPVKIEQVMEDGKVFPYDSYDNPNKTMLTVVDMNEATHIAIYVVDNHNYDYPILIEKDCHDITGLIQILRALKASQ